MTETAREQHHNEVKAFDVCSSCGVARKERETKCKFCHADHTSQALRPPRFDDELWVWIETTFQCRTCGFSVPLNHIDMDGAVVCGKCGAEQAFDAKGWHQAFDFAHSTADYGPGNTGFGKVTFDTGNQFTVLTVAGHPLCETCHGLLSFTSDHRNVDVSCGACKTVLSYIVPEAAWKTTRSSLRAVISSEHRADHNAVKVVETGAAVAIHCPQCEAPLDASEGAKFLHCKYCNMTSRIPDDVWFRVNGNEPMPVPMWLAFSGPSPERRETNKRHEDKLRSDAKNREIAEERQKRALQHAHEQEVKEETKAKKEQVAQAEKEKTEAIAKAKDRRQSIIVAALIFGSMALVTVVTVAWELYAHSNPDSDSSESQPAPTPPPTPKPTPTHVDRTPPGLRSATPAHHH